MIITAPIVLICCFLSWRLSLWWRPHLTLRRCPVSRVQMIPRKGLDDVLSYN